MLTAQQLTTLKASINAETDAVLVAQRNAKSDQGIADWYNGDHASQMVWRPAIPVAELMTGVVWAAFEALTVAKQNTWFALTKTDSIDATSANIRAGFAQVFSGATVTNLTAIAQRKATRFEAMFTAANVSSKFGHQVSATDIARAMAS